MELDGNYSEGQTPLDINEMDGLLLNAISTHGELNEFEQQNIEQAMQWLMTRNFKPLEILSEKFICEVHKRMYRNVWAWAGKYRQSNKNLGVDKWQIPSELKYLIDDAKYRYENNIFPPDEMAVRFKHRIVSIHCFANGNGRHSRLMADIIIEKIYNLPVFTWGASQLSEQGDIRNNYLRAVKTADKGDFSLLLKFARS